jgi:20S proteasome alpha/beta subunit
MVSELFACAENHRWMCGQSGIAMSLEALNFLENWVDDNVVNQKLGELSVAEARQLVSRCVREAKEHGISVTDMEAEVGDLAAFIAASLDRR